MNKIHLPSKHRNEMHDNYDIGYVWYWNLSQSEKNENDGLKNIIV